MIARSASFRAADLTGVLAVGRFRCRGCYSDICMTEPVNPERPTQGPLKCERCGDMPIIVSEPREAAPLFDDVLRAMAIEDPSPGVRMVADLLDRKDRSP